MSKDLGKDGSTQQFNKSLDHGRVAFESYTAIWRNYGEHVIIGAPSIEALTVAWERIVGAGLDKDKVQHVRIIKLPE